VRGVVWRGVLPRDGRAESVSVRGADRCCLGGKEEGDGVRGKQGGGG